MDSGTQVLNLLTNLLLLFGVLISYEHNNEYIN